MCNDVHVPLHQLIAGKELKSIVNHNMIGNDECDGLRITMMAQFSSEIPTEMNF